MMIRNKYYNKRFLILFFSSVVIFFNTIFFSNLWMDNFFISSDKSIYVVFSALFFLSSYLYILFEMNNIFFKEKLKKSSSEDLKNLLDISKDGLAILDGVGSIVQANKAYAVLQGGVEATDVLHKNWTSFYSVEQRKRLEDVLVQLHDEGQEWEGECVLAKFNRVEVTHHILIKRIGSDRFSCLVRDVPEIDELEMIKTAVESAKDGMAIVSNDNKILFVNDSFLTIHGLKPNERNAYIGSDWRHIYSPKGQENINSYVLPSTIIKGYWAGYLDVMRKDGSMFYGDASLTRLSNNLILGVMRDVTERKCIEKEREKIKEQMFNSKKMEAITRLIKGMGGDFKNALSTIRDRAENAIRTEEIPEERRKYMSDIIEASDRASEMVEQIMSFSEGKNTNASVIDVVDLILNVSNKVTRGLKSKVKCITDISIDSGYIFGDSGQIQKIIMALCENSVESLGDKAGTVLLSLRDAALEKHEMQDHVVMDDVRNNKGMAVPVVKSKENRFFLLSGFIQNTKAYYRITISDTGGGIFPEVLPNVLDPFFTTKNREKSAGLGLSSVHGTVLSYDGAMIVESEVGVGTSIHLFLPQYIREEDVVTELKTGTA